MNRQVVASHALAAEIERLEVGDDAVLMVMIAETDRPDIPALIQQLNRREIPFFGGIFPGLIHGQLKLDSGAILLELPATRRPLLIQGLGAELPKLPDLPHAAPRQTAVVLVDGLSAQVAPFLTRLFNQLGNSMSYFGGGAGSLSLEQQPCVFSNAGFFEDAAVVALVDMQCSLGVRHGWTRLDGPIVVTRSHENVIEELNWDNAFSVYNDCVQRDRGRPIEPDDFFSVSKGYPFGLLREGAEDVVRDPIAVTDAGELVCVGAVPENAVVNILRGDRQSLISAAGAAAQDCLAGGSAIRQFLIADCISRVIFLEEEFYQELDQVARLTAGTPKPLGMLTLGEISSYGDGMLELFNKTIVVAGLS